MEKPVIPKLPSSVSANLAAQYFASKNNDKLKTQKLLYFAQCVFFKLFKKPLFSEHVEFWKYGPVVPEIYGKWKTIVQQEFDLTTMNDATSCFLNAIDEFFENFPSLKMIDFTNASSLCLNKKLNEEISFENVNEKFPSSKLEKELMESMEMNCFLGHFGKVSRFVSKEEYVQEMKNLEIYPKTREEWDRVKELEQDAEKYINNM